MVDGRRVIRREVRPTTRFAGGSPGATVTPTPWATGLVVAGFVAAVIGTAIVILSLGLTRVHPLLAAGLNVVAVGGLAPTVWEWRRTPVLRWFVAGAAAGVAGGWLVLLTLAMSG